MKVTQETDQLDARVVRKIAVGLLLAIAICGAAAVLILELELGALAPRRFEGSRSFASLDERAAIELGLFGTLSARGERGEAQLNNPLSMPADPGSARPAMPLDQALEQYLQGARPPRASHDPRVDYSRLLPGASP
jgi:hypothetical protein